MPGETIEQVNAGRRAKLTQRGGTNDFRMGEPLVIGAGWPAHEHQPGSGGKIGLLEQARGIVRSKLFGPLGNSQGGEVAAGLVDQQGAQHDLAIAFDQSADEGGYAWPVEEVRAVRDDVAAVGCSQERARRRPGANGFQSASGPWRATRRLCARMPSALVASIGQAHSWRKMA